MKIDKIEKSTRKLFHELHTKHLSEKTSVSRLRSLLSSKKLGLNERYLVGKKCLDAGCGSSFHGTINLFQMGAEEVVSLDLNKTIYSHEKKIRKLISSNKKLTVKTGSVLKLPFKNNSFDFVLCQGVMHHTTNPVKAVKECYRVLRKGGYAYFQICGKGGIIQEFLMDFMRRQYKEDKKVKKFMNELNKKNFDIMLKYISSKIHRQNDIGSKASAQFIKNLQILVDEDLILTIKDRVLSPLYFQYDFKEVKILMKKSKFKSIKRVFTYPKYTNLRNLVSYFYSKPDNHYSKLLYGSGLINVLCKK